MTNQSLEERLVEKLRWARNDGSVVVGDSEKHWIEMAALARRRWFSFERRKPRKVEDNLTNRIEDLARGLGRDEIDQWGISSPVMSDYRWLSSILAEVFLTDPEESL